MSDAAATSVGRRSWLLVLALTIHVLEEVWTFPAWATLHFGTTTTEFFLVSHIPLFAVAIWCAWGASRSPAVGGSVWVLLAYVSALVVNVVFHLSATLILGEYGPGLATAVLVFLPVAWILGPATVRALSSAGARSAVGVGIVASMVVIWSLTTEAPTLRSSTLPSITDTAYLQADLWNDGQAEMAFYRVERTQNQYGQDADQQFLVGTYLVKHDFDPAAGSKATASSTDAVSAFKYALFYEFESLSYEYKRSWVANLRQADLAPLKASFASFDWCANQYREFVFGSDGAVDHLFRSDDYGNATDAWLLGPGVYPPAAIPVLIRGLDLSDGPVTFRVLTHEGSTVRATASLEGSEVRGGLDAQRISLSYDGVVESLIGEDTAPRELWWRSTGPDRRLIALEATDGRYSMELVELLRSPYWEEDVYERLEIIRERP
ncbi:MAG: HXXEE domain-containing protein [Rhodothermales bacterium]|nr:HXXEE domain-containing protein [Rhodothermales bacterium]